MSTNYYAQVVGDLQDRVKLLEEHDKRATDLVDRLLDMVRDLASGGEHLVVVWEAREFLGLCTPAEREAMAWMEETP